jgi:excisionase family DNA binding protein
VKAAQALGISVRTVDYCIANHGIRVARIGRRVLVPINSLEALLKQASRKDCANSPSEQDVCWPSDSKMSLISMVR